MKTTIYNDGRCFVWRAEVEGSNYAVENRGFSRYIDCANDLERYLKDFNRR